MVNSIKNSQKNSDTYLCVVPIISEKDELPVYVVALEKLMGLFECKVKPIGVSNAGSWEWKTGEWSPAISSRRLAKSFIDGGYAGVFLFVDNVTFPPGFICWIESFPDLEKNKVNVIYILSELLDNKLSKLPDKKKEWLVLLSGSKLENNIIDLLWDKTLTHLAHEQRNLN